MGITQDPTHPTGVVSTAPRGNSELTRARKRKAHAALALAAKSVSWDDIAEQLGFPDGDRAQAAVESALEDDLLNAESQEYLRALAAARLEGLIDATYTTATNTDAPDQLAHVDRVIRIIKEQSELLGFKAPQEFTVNNPSAARLEAWVAQVIADGTSTIKEADIFGEPVEMVEISPGVYEQKQEKSDAVQPE